MDDFRIQELAQDGEHEILYMAKQVSIDGKIFNVEISFMSDHQVFSRLALNGVWDPYKIGLWRTLDDVRFQAVGKEEKGWNVVWNPTYTPSAQEFVKRVAFSN